MSEKSIEEMNLPSDIVEMVDAKGNRIYPLSHTKGIIDDLGRTLDELFSTISGDVIDTVERLIQGAPEEHDTLIEVSNALKEGDSAVASIIAQVTEAKNKVLALENALLDYITTATADNKYATKVALADYLKTSVADTLYVALDSYNTFVNGLGETYAGLGTDGKVLTAQLPDVAKLELGETATTAYPGDKGKSAYDHVSAVNNPHGVNKTQVGLSNVQNIGVFIWQSQADYDTNCPAADKVNPAYVHMIKKVTT